MFGMYLVSHFKIYKFTARKKVIKYAIAVLKWTNDQGMYQTCTNTER